MGEHVRSVEKATGTKVSFEEGKDADGLRIVIVSGPLLQVYVAHAMLMKAFHQKEVAKEAEKQAEEERLRHVDELQSELQRVQEQLEMAKRGATVSKKGG